MPIQNYPDRQKQAGFTLVELAIVMIIIGLLIGGILKGQELIANAQITSVVSQMKGIDAAASTFRDSYNAFPGDFSQANTRLSATGCNSTLCTPGNGDGRIAQVPGAIQGAYGTESVQFFNHLKAANLLTGLDGTATIAFGQALPTASVGGGYTIGYSANGTATGLLGAGNTLRAGHYLALSGSPLASAATGQVASTQAARIDRKVDDGVPNSGSVQASGAATCITGNRYNEAVENVLCGVFFRVQN